MRRRNAAAALVLVTALAACSDDDEQAGSIGPPPAEAVAEAFFADPASYAGERVTFVGEVDTILNNDAFTVIAQAAEDSTEDLLVVHPGDLDVAAGSPIELTGTLQPEFDPPSVQPFRDVFAEDPAFEPFVGQPYLAADAVDKSPDEQRFDPEG